MRGGYVHRLTSRHKRAGVALRAVLDKPGWDSTNRMRNAMLQGSVPVRHDVDWPDLP